MMRKTRMFAVFAAVLLFCGVIFTACGENPAAAAPKLKDPQPEVAFTVDAYSSAANHEKKITIADYIDENGVEGVSYTALSDKSTVASASRSGGTVTVRGVKAGDAKVTLNAVVGGETIVSVVFDVTVIDTTPAKYDVAGLGNREIGTAPDPVYQWVVTGEAQATEKTAYTFTVAAKDAEKIPESAPAVSYTIGSATLILDEATESAGVFTYTVPAEEVVGPITIGNIDGTYRNRAQYAVTGVLVDNPAGGYTVTVPATALEKTAYAFSIALEKYWVVKEVTVGENTNAVPVTVTYKVGAEEENKTVNGTRFGNQYRFVIRAEEVVGDIEILEINAVTALLGPHMHNVSSTAAETGYELFYAPLAYNNVKYFFQAQVDLDYDVADKLTAEFSVDDGTPETFDGVLVDKYARLYEFAIYASKINNTDKALDIEILDITGAVLNADSYQEVTVTVNATNEDYFLDAEAKALTGSDYAFRVGVPKYYDETTDIATATATVNSAVASIAAAPMITNLDNFYNYYEFTVPKEELTGAVAIDVDLPIGSLKNAATHSNLSTGGWGTVKKNNNNTNTTAAESSAPTANLEEGGLKFTDTVTMKDGVHANGLPSVKSSNWIQTTIEVKTAGIFEMLLFATSNTGINTTWNSWKSADNWLRLYSEGTDLHLTTCQATVNNDPGAISGPLGTARGAWTANTWIRIDLISRTLVAGTDGTTAMETNPGRAELKLFIDGVWVELDPGIDQSWSRVINGTLNTFVGRPNYGGRTAVWAKGGEEGSIYVRNYAPVAP